MLGWNENALVRLSRVGSLVKQGDQYEKTGFREPAFFSKGSIILLLGHLTLIQKEKKS